MTVVEKPFFENMRILELIIHSPHKFFSCKGCHTIIGLFNIQGADLKGSESNNDVMMTDLQKENGLIFVWYSLRVYHKDT